MNLYFTKLICCFLFLLPSVVGNAQTTFTASVNPTKADRDEYITLTLTVAMGSNVQNITAPPLPDFKIVSGPNTSSEENTINGVTSQYISLSYVLLAKKPGTFKIAAATALINGRTFKSNNLTIVVGKKSTGNSQQNNYSTASIQSLLSGVDPFNEPQTDVQFSDYILRKGEDIPQKVSKNMQLKLLTSKTSCYVGEPLLATYKLYTRLKSESSLSKNPSFNGFSVVEMIQQNDANEVSTEQLNGRSYNVYCIRKAQLYPLQAGNIELEAASLDNKISFIKYTGNKGNQYNIDPNAMVTETVTLSSKPTTINVKPLPETGKPDGFKGSVGNFTIESTIQKNNFCTNETGKLIVTIAGSGNMQLLTLPDINWPNGFEIFDTKIIDNTNIKTIPISGSKTFEILFSVPKVGSYILPKINFSFFDPLSSTYKSIATDTIKFSVLKANAEANTLLQNLQKEKNTPTSLLNNYVENRWLVILFIAGAIIAGLIFWMAKEKKEEEKFKKNQSSTNTKENNTADINFIPQNPLTKSEDCIFKNECVSFYSIINEEMKSFLSKQFHFPSENMNSKTLSVVMDKAGVDNTIILQTQQLMQDIEWQLYTPFERNEAINEMYNKAQSLVQLIGTKTYSNL